MRFGSNVTLRSLMAFAGIRSFPNEERRTSWRLESIRQLPYSMSSILSGLRRRRLSKHQLIWLAFRCFNGIDKTSELILSACPTEVKKRLNSSATVLSSPLNDLWLVDFLGIHDHFYLISYRLAFCLSNFPLNFTFKTPVFHPSV